MVIVLWVGFGLVSVALYFAHSMSLELRAADNRVAAIQAEQAINGAARYVGYLLSELDEPGMAPDVDASLYEAVPVGEANFWLIGRGDDADTLDLPLFGLVDEASKLNLNTATLEMLELLPGMTAEFAAAIIDWRDSDSEPGSGGVEDDTYLRLNPPYHCKNGDFESVEELRLVYGATLEILYGEDLNRNGVLDPNENDGDVSPPPDNRDGHLDPGILEYLTVYTRAPQSGSSATDSTSATGSGTADSSGTIYDVTQTNRTEVITLLGEQLGEERASQISQQLATANDITSVLEFFARSGMTADEFALVEANLGAGTNQLGLINVNTASEAVLTCIPGIGTENAGTVVAERLSNPEGTCSVAWVADVLSEEAIKEAGPYLIGRTYQFTADIAALGRHGRGYRRVRLVFDTSSGTPQVLFRQDLTHLGWALGAEVREQLQLARQLWR